MLNDPRVTRLLNGITNVDVDQIFASLMEPDPAKYIRDFEEWMFYLATDWTTGGVGTGTVAATTGLGGRIVLTNSAADNDNRWIQRPNPNFQIVTGKRLFFSAWVTEFNDATQSDVVVGLQPAPAANNITFPANGIFFRKDDDAATLSFVSRAAAVETSSGQFMTVANATEYRMQFFYDGQTDLWYGVNGVVRGRLTPAAFPGTLMSPTFGIQNGAAAAKSLTMDQFLVLQER